MEELIKNILAGIGMIAIVGWGAMWIPGVRHDEKIMAACADQHGTIKYKTLDGKTFCKVDENKWKILVKN